MRAGSHGMRTPAPRVPGPPRPQLPCHASSCSAAAGRALHVTPFEQPERYAAEQQCVDGEHHGRVRLIRQYRPGEATRGAGPARDVPHEEVVRDVLEPAEEVRHQRDYELLREVVAEADGHAGGG